MLDSNIGVEIWKNFFFLYVGSLIFRKILGMEGNLFMLN